MNGIYLALGSNLGDKLENLNSAIVRLSQKGIIILKRSAFIKTEPVGGPPQENFLNGVIQVETILPPLELLTVCKNTEEEMGRQKTVRNGPRIIDIDILLYNDVILNSDALTIPHPRMFERSFVLKPLQEIAPHINKKALYANY